MNGLYIAKLNELYARKDYLSRMLAICLLLGKPIIHKESKSQTDLHIQNVNTKPKLQTDPLLTDLNSQGYSNMCIQT